MTEWHRSPASEAQHEFKHAPIIVLNLSNDKQHQTYAKNDQ